MKYRIVKRMNPLDNTEFKYYAAPQYMEELTVRDLAKDISDACTLNVTDVEAVLTSLVRKLPLYLKNGFKIQLGTFGRVKLSFSSKGSEKKMYVYMCECMCICMYVQYLGHLYCSSSC